MIKYRYLGFDQNISEFVSRENATGNNLFICPNYSSLSELRYAFQQETSLQKVEFLTMEEFKLKLLQSATPFLKEEKRTLAFYASLTAEQKKYFHITNYFQSLSLARKFFTFFEEMAEELVTVPQVTSVLQKREMSLQWQAETFQQLLDIKDTYHAYINSRGFSDLIFRNPDSRAGSDWLSRFVRVIVVNQFYFTRLEKKLLPPEQTVIYLQLPAEIFDEKELSCKPEFSAAHLQQKLTEEFNNIVFSDEFSLKYHLFSGQYDPTRDAVIDLGLLQDHLQAYGVQSSTGSAFSIQFSATSIYSFYQALHILLAEIIMVDGRHLISLNSLLAVCSDDRFVSLFRAAPPEEEQAVWEAVLAWLYELADQSYKYLDLSLELTAIKPVPAVKALFTKLFAYLQKFSGIADFQGFQRVLQAENSISIRQLMTTAECRCSDVAEVFYRLLEDFWILAEINVIDDWQEILGSSAPEGFTLSKNLLHLFLDYAKAKSCHFYKEKTQENYLNITALHNTRNLAYENIIIVDTIEGNIPPVRQTPFLLTEIQRRELGLKTYADIVLREKYYFFRLVAQAKKVTFLSRQREEDATEISSFVEELHLQYPRIFSENENPVSYLLQGHCRNWLQAASPDLKDPEIPSDFYQLPFTAATDLKDSRMIISPSSVMTLIEQPFNYYFQNMLNLQKRETSLVLDYSPLQLGLLVHEVFALIWERIMDEYQGGKIHQDFNLTQNNFTELALDSYLMRNPELLLQKPHNHSELYFQKIIRGFIEDSLKKFIAECEISFTDQEIRILPEAKNQNENIALFDLDSVSLELRGRADLRIEVLPSGRKHIYDYKTGKFNKSLSRQYAAQLYMYHRLYYDLAQETGKWIFFVTDQQLQDFSRINITYQELEASLQSALTEIFKNGYTLGERAALYEDDELTRRSLVKQRRNN